MTEHDHREDEYDHRAPSTFEQGLPPAGYSAPVPADVPVAILFESVTPEGCECWVQTPVGTHHDSSADSVEEEDVVNRPKHYSSHPSGIETIDVTEHMLFNLGNVIKYVWRADLKGDPIQNLEKASWYLNREIQRRKKMREGER